MKPKHEIVTNLVLHYGDPNFYSSNLYNIRSPLWRSKTKSHTHILIYNIQWISKKENKIMNFGCNYLVPHSGDPWISMKENQIMKPKHEIVINLVLHYEDPNFLEFKSIQYKVSIMENQNKNTHTHILIHNIQWISKKENKIMEALVVIIWFPALGIRGSP